jgi:peptidoglycan/LPS O-acetylase OafA/YrhL
MVALHHFMDATSVSLPLLAHAYLFVDFFFVLSGFVIATSYRDRLATDYSLSRFMWLRFARIYPLHLFMLAVFFAVESAFALVGGNGFASREPFSGAFDLQELLSSIFLAQIFLGTAMAWNGPSWSIAAEMWTYGLFGLVMRFAPRWVGPTCLVIALIVPFVLPLLSDHGLNVIHGGGALLRCLFGFALGVVAQRWLAWCQQADLSAAADTMLELTVVIGLLTFLSEFGASRASLAAPYLFFIAILVFARERGRISRLLKGKWAIGIGALSYSIYMVHMFVLYRFKDVLVLVGKFTGDDLMAAGHPVVLAATGALFLLIVLVCARLTNSFIELPGQALLRERISMHRPAFAAAS